jgi:hypothetical protein
VADVAVVVGVVVEAISFVAVVEFFGDGVGTAAVVVVVEVGEVDTGMMGKAAV